MKPEKQLIAIAEACGWKEIGKSGVYQNIEKGINGCIPRGEIHNKRLQMKLPGANNFLIPDYVNDLNAMHEAEKRTFIGPRVWDQYCDTLRWVMAQFVERKCGPGSCCGIMCLEAAVGATAAERAEAFLRTIGKWEE